MMKLTAEDLKQFGIVDKIIKEPGKGAHDNPSKTAELIRSKLLMGLSKIEGIQRDTLLEKRLNKYRNIGEFSI